MRQKRGRGCSSFRRERGWFSVLLRIHYEATNPRYFLRSHCRDGPSLSRFKSGAFAAAISAGVPVLPVVFSHYDFLDTAKSGGGSSWPDFSSGTATMSVLDPVETADLEEGDAHELCQKVWEEMQEELVNPM